MSHSDIQNRNIETVQTALKNAFAGNFDVLRTIIAEDFVIYEAEGLPFGGVFRGLDGYVECMKGLDGFFADKTLVAPEFVPAGDDKVLMLSSLDGYMAHNRQHLQMPTISRWDFTDGKISQVRVFFFDTKKVADLAAL